MGGWQKPVAPPRVPTWEDLVLGLYLRSDDMTVGEFESLMAIAVRGQRPDHPDLPQTLLHAALPSGLPPLGGYSDTVINVGGMPSPTNHGIWREWAELPADVQQEVEPPTGQVSVEGSRTPQVNVREIKGGDQA